MPRYLPPPPPSSLMYATAGAGATALGFTQGNTHRQDKHARAHATKARTHTQDADGDLQRRPRTRHGLRQPCQPYPAAATPCPVLLLVAAHRNRHRRLPPCHPCPWTRHRRRRQLPCHPAPPLSCRPRCRRRLPSSPGGCPPCHAPSCRGGQHHHRPSTCCLPRAPAAPASCVLAPAAPCRRIFRHAPQTRRLGPALSTQVAPLQHCSTPLAPRPLAPCTL